MPEPPQYLLPFAEREYVDMKRAQRILGASWMTVSRLADEGLLDIIEYRRRGRKKVRYASIVDFCDNLRRHYQIPDRRPRLSAVYLRHRDEDLLPFRLRDTMSSEEALAAMGTANRRIIPELVEEGRFEAYRLVIGAPWRISRPSFVEYLAEVQKHSRNSSFPLRRRNITEDCTL